MTPTPDRLRRVREATGAEWDLDREIGLTVGGWRSFNHPKWGERIEDYDGNQFPDNSGALYSSFTESLDAALELLERVRPGTILVLRKSAKDYWLRDGIPAGQWGVILDDVKPPTG